MPGKMALVDTSAWIEYLKKSQHPVVKQVESSLIFNNAATSLVNLAELLQVAKSEKEIEAIQDLASVAKILKDGTHTWWKAGLLSNKLRRQGRTLPLIDCYLAILARENNAAILTLDKHFSAIDEHL